MVKFANCEMKAGHVSLTLRGGITEYKVYGYALTETIDNVEYIKLQPADRRCSPVFRCEKSRVSTLTVHL